MCNLYTLYATPKSRSCFCLPFRPKDDAVLWILVQGRSLLGSKMLRYLYVSVSFFGYRDWFSLFQNQYNNKTQAYVYVILDYSDLWLRGLGVIWIDKLRWEGFNSSKKAERAKKKKNYWVDISGCISLYNYNEINTIVSQVLNKYFCCFTKSINVCLQVKSSW